MFLRHKGGVVVAMRWGEETWNSWNVVLMRRIYAFFAFFCQGGEGENRHVRSLVLFWYGDLRLARGRRNIVWLEDIFGSNVGVWLMRVGQKKRHEGPRRLF
jgi:hypothetical protein